MDAIGQFFDALFSFPWRKIYETIRAVFIILDVILIAAFIYVFVKSLEYRPKFYRNPKRAKKTFATRDPQLQKRWKTLLEKSKSNPPQSYTLAIIEADKFVDDVLKKMGLQGEHMADRLERLGSSDLKTLDRLWRVHRIRNELVHNTDFNISRVDAGEVLEGYEVFLKELEVI